MTSFTDLYFKTVISTNGLKQSATLCSQHPDPELEKIADDAIQIVCAAQQDDGYLDTYYILNGKDKIFSN